MNTPYDLDQDKLDNLAKVLQSANKKLTDYELQMIDAPDEDTIFNIQQQAERIRRQRNTHETEFRDIRKRSGTAPAVEITQIEALFGQIDEKLAVILVKLEDLHQDILNQLDAGIRQPMQVILARLDAPQSAETREALHRLEGRTVEAESAALPDTVTAGAKALLQHSGALSPEQKAAVEKVLRVIDDPEMAVSHKLKISIPIVPFLVSYEGEIGLDVAANVRSAYERLKKTLGISETIAHP